MSRTKASLQISSDPADSAGFGVGGGGGVPADQVGRAGNSVGSRSSVGSASSTGSTSSGGSKKSETTRAVILEAALELFRTKGYEATTMRAIASAAGVSLGNAYYYFASKEHLVQGFYDRIAIDHAVSMFPRLVGETDLERRILIFIENWLEICAPYASMSGKFFKFAAEPGSPLSPFSQDSTPARQASIGAWKFIIDGSDLKVPPDLRAELPELLWLAFMGIVLYWVHDSSPDSQRTKLLARRLVPMVVRTLELAKLPMVRSTVNDLLGLLTDLRDDHLMVCEPTA